MNCPVCKNNLTENAKKCPKCGFENPVPSFINYEDAENWMKTEVEPYRLEYKKKLDADHQHSYRTRKVEPTCTEQGYTLHWCDCGYEYGKI